MVVTKTVRRQKPENGEDDGADDDDDDSKEEEEAAEERAEEIQTASYDGQETACVCVTTAVKLKASRSTVFAPL